MSTPRCNWDPGCEVRPNPTPMPQNDMGPSGMDRLEVERRRMTVVHELRAEGGPMTHERTRARMVERYGHR